VDYKQKLWRWDFLRSILYWIFLFVAGFAGLFDFYMVTNYWLYPDYAWFGTWLDYVVGQSPAPAWLFWTTVPPGMILLLYFDRLILKSKKTGILWRGISLLSLWLLYIFMWLLSLVYYLQDSTGLGPIKSIADPYNWWVWSVQFNQPSIFIIGMFGSILMSTSLTVSTYLFVRAIERQTELDWIAKMFMYLLRRRTGRSP